MKTFRCSGKAGDLVYSLPTIQHFGGGVLYIPYDAPEVPGFYNNMHTFIESQGIECRPYIHKGGYMESLPDWVDYDLDLVRLQPHRGRKFMVQQYFDAFGIKAPTPDRWLDLDVTPTGLNLLNVTARHKYINWNAIPDNVIFVGDEHDCPPGLARAKTRDFLAFAQLIASASALYCIQSAALTIAQACGINYYCTFKPGKTNCRTYAANEHTL